MSQSHIEEHIDLIAKHEQDFLVRRTPSERLGDTIAGALTDGVWYGGMALCAAAYVALFVLIAFGYRLLMPASR